MPLPARATAAAGPWRRTAAALLLTLAACAPAPRHPAPAVEPTPAPPAPALPEAPPVVVVVPLPPVAPDRRIVPPTDGAEHYLDQVLAAQRGRLVRWARAAHEPIRLWIPPLPAPLASPRADYPTLVSQAMAAWNDVGLPVWFVPAADSAHADVRLRWVRSDAEADVAGRAHLLVDGRTGHITSVTLALATHGPSGYPHPPATMLGIALHELGHALGIEHTGRADCVMFPIPQRAELCAADRETARRWYALPAGVAAAELPR